MRGDDTNSSFGGNTVGGGAVPKVTVGLAVYNGEEYLEQAIESILAQTFKDFELVICDNNSTDSTPTICARYASRDPRIRYYRNAVNIGGVRNENRSMFLARGRYFKLAAHDDRIAPEFLERCVQVLDARQDVEVCTTDVVVIDEDDHVIETRLPRAGTEDRPYRRIREIARSDYACEATYGVMRMRALREVRPQTNHLHSDRVVLSELALRGRFYLIEAPLFYKRIYKAYVDRDWRARMAWYQPDLIRSGGIRLPHWHQVVDYVAMISRSNLEPRERLRCTVELLRCFWRMRRDLLLDFVDALRMAFSSKRARQQRYMRAAP